MNRVDNNYVLNQTKINNQTKKILDTNINTRKSTSFEEILSKVNNENKTENVKFSKHALSRLDQRNIVLSENEIKDIDTAVKKAETKGIKDALIIMGDKTFVANIKNKTIVTASTNEKLKDNVFTNIDGAVII